MKYRFKTAPDKHQFEALKMALDKRRFGIFFQQRVGKTKVAIDFAGATYLKDGHNKVLIICPLSVREEWVSQLGDHFPLHYEAHLYPKTKKHREQIIKDTKNNTEPTFLIANYDIITNDIEMFKSWGAHTIIFDESHLIGRHNSNRSKSAAKLGELAQNVLLLTGTPIPKRWYNIFGQFRAMDKTILGGSFHKFISRWGIKGGYMGKEIVGCVNYDALSKVIAIRSIRVLRKDVFDEPKVENVIVPITMSGKSYEMYYDLVKRSIAEIDAGKVVTVDMAMTKLLRLHQLCGGFATSDLGEVVQVSTDKLDIAKDLIRTQLEGDEPVVIFYAYSAEGKALKEICKTLTKKPIGEINGRVSEADRKLARDRFQSGDSDIILIQIATGAMGISLDRAHINIFYSLNFSLTDFQQARDRVMGRGQKNDVTNYMLAVKGTVDHRVMKILQKDEEIAIKVADARRWIAGE